MSRLRRPPFQAALVAIGGGLLVFGIAHLVFPYHSTNHDEAVYLQQAAMLLEGQLFLEPPVRGPFRPWFFVADGGRLYPKYSPVAAAMFAGGKLLGGYRVTLALVAAAALGLTFLAVREVFDDRTGVVASLLLLASPLFLVDASVFLAYVPTTVWNLAFAASYLHADRTGSHRTAAVAGAAIGIAFFSRPYTAILFATPFVVHAVWSLRTLGRPRVVRLGLTAGVGLVGVLATLGYNAVVTGDPLLFPYQAFAPEDGLGFGHRQILGYERTFTPVLSLRANARLLWLFATEWFVAGPLGTLALAAGLWTVVRRGITNRELALGSVLVTVPLGNLYFWGTLNMVGALSNPDDGLVRFLGPYYHVDMLLPAAGFAAVGVLASWDRLRAAIRERVTADRVRPALVATALLVAAIGGSATVAAAGAQLEPNYDVSRQYEAAYAPFEQQSFDDSVVLLPTPYGDWLNHPFQPLRNDPGYDEGPVYAMQDRQFAVLDAFPGRTYYRYVYRGQWAPFLGKSVTPRIQRVRLARGPAVVTNVTLGVPETAEVVSIRLTNGSENDYATLSQSGQRDLRLVSDANRTRLLGTGEAKPPTVATPANGTVALNAFVDFGTSAGFTYRVVVPVQQTDRGVRALTPRLEQCWDQRRCGGEAAFVPGSHRDGVSLNASVRGTERRR